MRKQSQTRQYNFPDADLYVQFVERLKMANKDSTLFEQYGYDDAKFEQLKNLVLQFRNLSTDEELLGDQMVSTERKYLLAKELKAAIRSIMTRVAIKHGERTGQYRRFGANKLSDMNDPQLLFCARRVARVARAQILALEDVGVSENNIQRVLEASSVFEDAMHKQQDRIAERDISVEQRVKHGNKLYHEMVRISDIGKDIWRNKDEARHNAYAIYDSNNEQKKSKKNKSTT